MVWPNREMNREQRQFRAEVEWLDGRTLLSDFVSTLGGAAPAALRDATIGLVQNLGRRAALLSALEARREFPPGPRSPIGVPVALRPRPPVLFQATPLTDLGAGSYRGVQGGLYPGGSNVRPDAHERAGLERAGEVQPLDRDGIPSDDGRIVLLSIGMSNASIEFQAFQRLAAADAEVNPDLVIVNGAQNGASIDRLVGSPARSRQYFRTIEARLAQAGVSADQVQAIWINQADAGPRGPFPHYAQTLQGELAVLTRMLKVEYPNLQLAYVSSRSYGGYASIPLNPEPFAFESGFSVKWLVEQQIDGDPSLNFDPARGAVEAPWLSWGPYLWANGSNARSDGLSYDRSDFAADGTHPSPRGARKVAEQLLRFFKGDSTTQTWFLDL